MNKKPKRTKTQNRLTGWKILRGFMIGSKYVVAELPATIMVIVQHNEWFPTVTQTVSVSTGFIMFCITVLVSVFCIAKKSETYEKLSPFLTSAIYLIIFGTIALFMSNIINDLGWLCVYTGVGMVVAVAEDTLEKTVVKNKVDYWSSVLASAGLNVKETEQQKRKEADIKKAKEEARDLI